LSSTPPACATSLLATDYVNRCSVDGDGGDLPANTLLPRRQPGPPRSQRETCPRAAYSISRGVQSFARQTALTKPYNTRCGFTRSSRGTLLANPGPPPRTSQNVQGQRGSAQGGEQGQVLRHRLLCLVRQPPGLCGAPPTLAHACGGTVNISTEAPPALACGHAAARSFSRTTHALHMHPPPPSPHALHTRAAAPSSR
jgi:hypothetical protein